MSNNVLPDPLNVNVVSPDPLPTMVENQGTNYVDQKIQDGDYFSDFITRLSTVPETVYRVIKTGSVPLIIEDIVTNVDFSLIDSGKFQLLTRLYMQGSNRNTWAYTGGVTSKLGVPLNTVYLNKIPEWDLISGATISNLTGVPDFVISLKQFYRDSSGNRDSITGIANSFFESGRKIIIPPNTEALIETISSGDAGNTAELASFIHVIEPGDY